MMAHLGPARLRVQMDVGIGDAVTPAPKWLDYPTLEALHRSGVDKGLAIRVRQRQVFVQLASRDFYPNPPFSCRELARRPEVPEDIPVTVFAFLHRPTG